MKKVIAGATIAVAALAGMGASAFAGEVTGNGKGTPIVSEDGPTDNVGAVEVAPSACAFSGLEDTAGPGSTQTPRGSGGAPGFACRGSGGGRVDD
jgi:hypothetical protein